MQRHQPNGGTQDTPPSCLRRGLDADPHSEGGGALVADAEVVEVSSARVTNDAGLGETASSAHGTVRED